MNQTTAAAVSSANDTVAISTNAWPPARSIHTPAGPTTHKGHASMELP